ncbi:hypothetical protein MYCTH_2111519 [Thermothelomyces thermophilus ATCC 42464]|uniref:C2H2 type master regulator of conidiophore development brlA n=1 Tax=Thermothelomyces thermophilus (strain ATCC 42464 / BCRC 31852 / DSM 1799) TaxID=573729 RepID=G2QFZ6_THET4|nr:uncharacterized protein MYCTH_2111519 [Thermothelomyces thermophilus ATCC 42464]AEO59309.1 hypothetical protein MYCTH_2111519 [Thermothelomyces thermophilus ATCC 42464]
MVEKVLVALWYLFWTVLKAVHLQVRDTLPWPFQRRPPQASAAPWPIPWFDVSQTGQPRPSDLPLWSSATASFPGGPAQELPEDFVSDVPPQSFTSEQSVWDLGQDLDCELFDLSNLTPDSSSPSLGIEPSSDSPYFSQSSSLSGLLSSPRPNPISSQAASLSGSISASPHVTGSSNESSNLCRGCGKTFDSREKLKRHARWHTKNYQCPYDGCGARFSTRSELERHKKNLGHGGGKDERCPRCDKAFTRKYNMQRHYRAAHEPGEFVNGRV